MAAIEYAFRIDIIAQDTDGAWASLVWNHTDPESGRTHEAACLWTSAAGDALRVWRQLESGAVPRELAGSLNGWRGLVISPVQQLRRFARPEGWGPWQPHVAQVDGTHEIRTGSCAPGQGDPRFDDTLRQLLGLPPSGIEDAARMALEPGQEHVA